MDEPQEDGLPYDDELALTLDLVAAEHRLVALARDARSLCDERGLSFDPGAFLLAYDLGLTAALEAARLAPAEEVAGLLKTARDAGLYARVLQAIAEEA